MSITETEKRIGYRSLNFFLKLLLRKIKAIDIFNIFFWIFVLRGTEIFMKSNFWLEMYLPYILRDPKHKTKNN